jgi:hypothetical protein
VQGDKVCRHYTSVTADQLACCPFKDHPTNTTPSTQLLKPLETSCNPLPACSPGPCLLCQHCRICCQASRPGPAHLAVQLSTQQHHRPAEQQQT